MSKFRDQRITVIGLARSGVGAANLLSRLGAKVTVNDIRPREELNDALARLDPSVGLLLGSHPPELPAGSDLIVISPGIHLDAPFLMPARDKGVPVISELEAAYQALQDLQGRAPEILAVTGTNGKSTTTTLLYEMLKRDGVSAHLAGNIGTAMSEVLCDLLTATGQETLRQTRDVFVTEVSSFQLETTEHFRPAGATILNITEDHLDRYPSMDEYIEAKCRVFLNQEAGDFLVLNADDPLTARIEERLRHLAAERGRGPGVFHFSRKRRVRGVFLDSGLIRFSLPGRPAGAALEKVALDPDSFVIQGVHNIENAMAASLMALLAGCGHDAVRETLRAFPGLEHRLEFVREVRGVAYINDSKGTNTGAVIKSLEGFSRPVILIAGGRDKHSDFTVLRPLVAGKVRSLVLIGEASGPINAALGDLVPVFSAGSLESAVRKADELARPGDVVLLSPACASFDMFIDFEDRGRQFKQHVMAL